MTDNKLGTWVYFRTEAGLYTVGFYSPNGQWATDSDHDNAEAAAARCHYLNGGNPASAPAVDDTDDDAE